MLKDGFTHAAEDMATRKLREASVEAERMVLATRAALAADGELLDDGERARSKALMPPPPAAARATTPHAIEAASKALAVAPNVCRRAA